jgi:hypothetical protein
MSIIKNTNTQDYISAKKNIGINLSTISSNDLTLRQSTLEFNDEKSIHLLESIPDIRITDDLKELNESGFA